MPSVITVQLKPETERLVRNQLDGGIHVDACQNFGLLADKLKTTAYDLIIWEPRNEGELAEQGRGCFDLLRKSSPHAQVIVLTSNGRCVPNGWIEADHIHPIHESVLTMGRFSDLVGRALRSDSHEPVAEIGVPGCFEGMMFSSLAMREVVRGIVEAATTDITVLITGETGTGKDLVASAIHKRSKRKDLPYVPVNTGAMPRELIASELFGHERGAYTGAVGARPGFFEQANGGTIFLDEISTMDEKAQVSLLRVLETKRFRRVAGTRDIAVDVRVIAATNEDLYHAVEQKRFREDLYYRLDVMRIHVPPLRNRPGAVAMLTDHFVSHFARLYGKNLRAISPETYNHLRNYRWPGNVRELKNVIQRAVVTSRGREISPDLLPARIREAPEPANGGAALPLRVGMTVDAVTKELIKMTLAHTKGNKKAAGVILGISRRALYNKLKRYGLSA